MNANELIERQVEIVAKIRQLLVDEARDYVCNVLGFEDKLVRGLSRSKLAKMVDSMIDRVYVTMEQCKF